VQRPEDPQATAWLYLSSRVWWSSLLDMLCLWRHNITSYSLFQTNVLAKFVDITCIYAARQRWSDSGFFLSDPILFWKMISVSNPNPVLVKIILSGSEKYPKVYYDAQHTVLCCVYFALWGKIIAEFMLPLADHDWWQWSHDKFGMHVLLSWPWHLQQLSPTCMDKFCNGFKASKHLAASCLH